MPEPIQPITSQSAPTHPNQYALNTHTHDKSFAALYMKSFNLQVIKSLQPYEGSRTRMLVN